MNDILHKSPCIYTELSKYYARLQTAVARGLGSSAGRQAGPHTDAAPKLSLCYFSSVSLANRWWCSVRTWRRRLTFLFFTEPVSFNLLACLLILLGLGTGCPGNFTRNFRRVSEHYFLLFVFYVLWIYTQSHNENSYLGMSQIAIITITTLTALMPNNNHNQ